MEPMENKDYQKIAKVVAHKKFGKVWELEKEQNSYESNGNQYAIRSSNSFFLADNYPPFTELYYNDFSNSFVLGNKKSENSLFAASVRVERGVKMWDVQNSFLKPLLENKQLIIKRGSDIYDANNYALGRMFVVDKLSMAAMVVGDNFKISLMLDDGKGSKIKSLAKQEFSEAEIEKVQLLHIDGGKSAIEYQNKPEAQKVKELIESLEAEGIESSKICVTSPYKNQLALYEEILKFNIPAENIFLSNVLAVPKKFEYMIFSIAAFEGNALLLKNSHTLIKKLMKSCDTFIIAGNIEFLFEKNQHLGLLLQTAYENGQILEL
jgi:hypothetical protein